MKELGTVGGEPVVGSLGGQGVVGSAVLQFRVDQHLVDPGAARSGHRAGHPLGLLLFVAELDLAVLLDGADLFLQGGHRNTTADALLHQLQQAGLFQRRLLGNLPQDRFEQAVAFLFFSALGQRAHAELDGRAGLGEQAFESSRVCPAAM